MTIKKVVNDRRAALDEEDEIRPALRSLVQDAFDRDKRIPRVHFPADSASIADSPKLTLVILDPAAEWTGAAAFMATSRRRSGTGFCRSPTRPGS